jgi:hypothetical protein
VLLGLFVVLIGLGLFLVWLSYYSKEALYSLVGFTFIFILGLWTILPGNLQLQTGENISTSYSYTNGTLTSANEVNVYNYTSVQDSTSRFFGIWLCVLSACGFAVTLFEIKGAKKKKGEDDEE